MPQRVQAVLRVEQHSRDENGQPLWHLAPVYTNEQGELSYEPKEGFTFAFNLPLGPVIETVDSVVLADVDTGDVTHAVLADAAQQEPLLANLRAQDDPRVDNTSLHLDVTVKDGALVADPAALDAVVADAVAAAAPVEELPVDGIVSPPAVTPPATP